MNKRIATVIVASGNEVRAAKCIIFNGFCGKFSLVKSENGSTGFKTRFWAKFPGANGLSKKNVHLDLWINSCSEYDLNNQERTRGFCRLRFVATDMTRR